MRVLGHIHAFNDEEVIDRSLQALLSQTYHLEEIVIIDNGSTDNTLNRSFPKQVKVIRHPEQRGTSGAVITGMRYALDKGYDWIWVIDADSAPRRDALQKLLELYRSFSPELQAQTWLLASLPVENTNHKVCHGLIFTSKGCRQVRPDPNQVFYECDFTIWSGSLFKLEAVKKVGLPAADYVVDWGEFIYGYLGKQAGYRAFTHQQSILDHNMEVLHLTSYRFGPLTFGMRELAPFRCYYIVRNYLHFWLYGYKVRNFYTLSFCLLRITKLIACFLIRPTTHSSQLVACVRGVWDALRGNLRQRY